MKRGGFTLIEIMIVVSIIGFLAAISMPNLMRAKATTLANKCVNNMRLIQAGKEQYAFENAVAPEVVPSESDLELYFQKNRVPPEPTGSTYAIGAISTNCTCNSGLSGHVL